MKALLSCLILLLCFENLFAQENDNKVSVSGQILDTENLPLVGATIVFLHPSDSVLAGYSITNSSGLYTVRNLDRGKYVLQVSYLGFLNVSKEVDFMEEKSSFQIPKIILSEESLRLDEVEVTADHIPIMLKKDTIEYNAAAFKTAANAKVEELLKKLPGVEVDQDGKIKAQGKEVNKIYVDGKEFFGDDPQIATKNLPADAVDKVQVFDKLSDLAEFTGIDDGERDKTINLTLKEDHKKGYFGNVSSGYGSNDRFESKANLNRFTDNSQFSFLGSANNTNTQNFSIQDYINFSGGLRGLASGNGGMSISIDGAALGGTNNTGITTSQSAGINFNTDLTKTTELRTSYFFNGIKNDLIGDVFSQNLIQDETFTTQSDQNSLTKNYSHDFNMRVKHGWNDQEISLRANLKYNDGQVSDVTNRNTFNNTDFLENTSEYNNESAGDNLSINTNLYYRRKLGKPGRSFVANISLRNNNDNKNAFVNSINSFFTNEILDNRQIISQEQDQVDDQLDYGVRLAYTEPIGGKKYLGLNYSNQKFTNAYDKSFYDVDGNNRAFNSALSNTYNRNYNYNRLGSKLLINRKNSTTTVGFELQSSTLKGTIVTSDTRINKDFFNYLPYLRWKYTFSSAASLNLNYSTRVREPSLRQLQPVIDNSDPLNLYAGNPDLNQEYTHNLNLEYNLFNMFDFTSLFVSMNGVYTKDKITNTRTIDDNFIQTIAPVNVDHDYLLNSYVSFSTPIRSIASKINIDLSSTYNNGILFINNIENQTTRWNNSYDVSLENRKKKIFDLKGGVRITRSSSRFSESQVSNQNFSTTRYYGNFSVDFLKKWSLNSTFYIETYQGDAFTNNAEIPIWTAYVSKNFLKYDRAQLKLYVFDILNENQGINRVNELNYVSDERYNTLSRYFMVSLSYSLSGFGKRKEHSVI